MHRPDRDCGRAWHLKRAKTHLPCAFKGKDGGHSCSNTTHCACGHPPSSTFPRGREAPSASFLCRQRPIRPSRLADLWESIEVPRTYAQRKRSWIGSTETPLVSQTVRGREGTTDVRHTSACEPYSLGIPSQREGTKTDAEEDAQPGSRTVSRNKTGSPPQQACGWIWKRICSRFELASFATYLGGR